MPYPGNLNRKRIIKAAREMIERDGLDRLSMRDLAKSLDVKAPSLYRYVNNKEALLEAVIWVTFLDLWEVMHEAAKSEGDVRTRLLKVFCDYRRFANRYRTTYQLAFTNTVAQILPEKDLLLKKLEPITILFAQWCGAERGFIALRGMVAMVHGWIMLENAGLFVLDGDVDAQFEQSINTYLNGIQAEVRG